MTNLNALRELEKRLAEAKGPDRKIDAAITAALCPCEPPDCIPDLHARIVAKVLDGGEDSEIERFTASLDAAVALVERVLPGTEVTLRMGTKNSEGHLLDATARLALPFQGSFGLMFLCQPEQAHGVPALALCLACVRALIAQGEQ